jgi:hypothetical protein
MSRVSRKSELSPSITKGSNGINLGKDSGVNMGGKAQPSVTSGGIGITQEVTNVGGVSVSGGVNVDITPVDFGISVNPSEGTVAVATGAELPGGLLGISGGIEIDTNTGQIIGGGLGGEIGGLGINVSNSQKGGIGIEFTFQIPGTPISLSLGFGFPPKEEPTPTPTPTPTPGTENPIPFSPPPPGPFPPPPLPSTGGSSICTVIVEQEDRVWVLWDDGRDEYAFSNTTGSVEINDLGYKKIFSSFTSKSRSRSGSVQDYTSPVQEFYPNWHQTPLYDYFGQGGIFGASGREAEVYKLINSYCHGYYERADIFSKGYRAYTYKVIYSDCPLSGTDIPPPNPPNLSPFPNPPPRKQNKMDACCRENLAFLRVIYTRLGLARFPGQLPNTIIQEVPQEGEEPAEPPQVPIPDLVSLLNWQFERDDERWGQWQVQIDIKDVDITKEGDQKKSIKLPNLAESMAEFEGQLLSIMTNVDALVALQIKNLAESGMARQEAIKGYLASKAIIKYMAFKSTEVDVPVPMTFTAGAETISKLLEESEGHIKGTDYVEKETLRDVYLDLLQAAAIIRAVHWQQIDTKTDRKSQLLSILKGSVDLATSITKPKTPNGDGSEKTFDPDKDFEDFIDSVEDGFRNTTGISDVQNPYGKPPNRRPRIRQIGDNISQAGEND